MKITEINVNPLLLQALQRLGFEDFTPVQEKAIPSLLEGKDAEVEAPTGTGKTLCYGLPLLNMLDFSITIPQGLVICPTRELAIQVEKELNKFGKDMPEFKSSAVYGGQNERYQIRSLGKKPQVVVATPGRLLDFIKTKRVDLSKVKYLVLDECDEMLDMGFIKDISAIISFLTCPHQTSLFSATISNEIREVSKRFMKKDFVSVKVIRDEAHLHQIDQRYIAVKETEKKEDLIALLNTISFTRAFVFARTKHKVKNLEKILSGSTLHSVTSLQGNLSQNKRDKAMEDFRSYKCDVMVATDIAARGIDISDVDLVVNFDPPEQDEFYLHRIGRTGRVEAKGTSYTFLTKSELYLVSKYEKMSKAKIEKYELPKEGIIMNKYLLGIEKDLKNDNSGKISEVKEAADHFTEVEGRTVLPIEIAAILLRKIEELSTETLPSDKHYESIERNKEKKTSYSKEGMKRYFVNLGTRDGLDEEGVKEFMAQATGVAEGDFGDVYLKESYSFFAIKAEDSEAIEKCANGLSFNGRDLRVDASDASREGRPAKKEYGGERRGSSYGRGGSSYGRGSSNGRGSSYGHGSSNGGSSYRGHDKSSGYSSHQSGEKRSAPYRKKKNY